MPYQQILQKHAYQGIFACRIHICDDEIPTNCKQNRKMNNFGNFCQFFEIFTETLEQNIQKICFLDGKEDK